MEPARFARWVARRDCRTRDLWVMRRSGTVLAVPSCPSHRAWPAVTGPARATPSHHSPPGPGHPVVAGVTMCLAGARVAQVHADLPGSGSKSCATSLTAPGGRTGRRTGGWPPSTPVSALATMRSRSRPWWIPEGWRRSDLRWGKMPSLWVLRDMANQGERVLGTRRPVPGTPAGAIA